MKMNDNNIILLVPRVIEIVVIMIGFLILGYKIILEQHKETKKNSA